MYTHAEPCPSCRSAGPVSPTSSEEFESWGPSAPLAAAQSSSPTGITVAPSGRRPPPLDLQRETLAWYAATQARTLGSLGSPLSPSPTSYRRQSASLHQLSGLADVPSDDLETPTNSTFFSLTTPPPLDRSRKSSSSTSSIYSDGDLPCTPSPFYHGDTERSPSRIQTVSPGTSGDLDMLNCPFQSPFRASTSHEDAFESFKSQEWSSKQHVTPPSKLQGPTTVPGAPKRGSRKHTPIPPSSEALQNIMGISQPQSRSFARRLENDLERRGLKTTSTRSRNQVGPLKSCVALQQVLDMPLAPPTPTPSVCSTISSSSTSSRSSSGSSSSKRSLPGRSSLPPGWMV